MFAPPIRWSMQVPRRSGTTPLSLQLQTTGRVFRVGAVPLALGNSLEGDQGLKLFEHARALNLEGVVSKRMESRYRSGPSRDWWKIKNPDYERR